MARPPPRWDAFVSYARADMNFIDAVLQAMPRARSRHWRLWVDRSSMPSRGEPFQREIGRAMAACDRVVVFLTRTALASEWVQAEWRQALANDQVVVPLLWLDPPPADAAAAHALLPPELAALQADDLSGLSAGDCARRLHTRLLERLQAPGPLSLQLPQVPGFHEPRPALHFKLAQLLGAGTATAAARTVLLHGMSGAGKSVVAAAFARAVGTRRAFDQGVLWLQASEWETASDDPQAAAQRALLRQLAAMPGSPDLASLRAAGCRMLVVVDDVKQARGLDALSPLFGPNVRVLLTSQQRDLSQTLSAEPLEVPPLTLSQSLSLIARMAHTTPSALPDAVHRLAVELGGLPYALAVVGAMAADDAWDDLRQRVTQSDLQSLARSFPGYPHPTVFAMLDAAVARLDDRARRLLRVLHVFGATQPVPEAVLVRYWQRLQPQPAHEARGLLSRLAQACLVSTNGEAPRRWVRIHELQLRHGLATARADEGASALAAHAAQVCETLPDEDDSRAYRLRALVQHLDEADDAEGLHRLLIPGERGSVDWHAQRTAAGDLAGYVDDVARAWAAQRRRPDDSATPPRGLSYALLASTGRAVHTRLSQALKLEACQRGLVSVDALLSEAELHDEPASRARMILELLPRVAGEQRAGLQRSIEALLDGCSTTDRVDLRIALAEQGTEAAAAQAALAWMEAGQGLTDATRAAAWGRIAALPFATLPQVDAALAALTPCLGKAFAQPVQAALLALMPRLNAAQRRRAIDKMLASPPPGEVLDRIQNRDWCEGLASLLQWAGSARQRRLAEAAIAMHARRGNEVSIEAFLRWLPAGYARGRFDQALRREHDHLGMFAIRDAVESFRLLVHQDGDASGLERLLAMLDRWPDFEGGFGVYATATARARLAPFTPPTEQAPIWEAALQASLRLPKLHQRQQAWAALREAATGETQVTRLLQVAMTGSQVVEDGQKMRDLVEALAPWLDRPGLALAQRMVDAAGSEFDRRQVSIALATRAFALGDVEPALRMLDAGARGHMVDQTAVVPLALLLDDHALDQRYPSFDAEQWLHAPGYAFALGKLVARLPHRLDALMAEPGPCWDRVKRYRDLDWACFIDELAGQGRPDLALEAARRLVRPYRTVLQIADETATDASGPAVQAFLKHAEALVGERELAMVRLLIGPRHVGADAFAAALRGLVEPQDGDNANDRARALAIGLRHADEAMRERWFGAALAAAALAEPREQVGALNHLARVAPATDWRRLHSQVRRLHASEHWAAVPLAPRLARLGLADEALALAHELPAPVRAAALACLVADGTDASETLLPQALDAVCALPDGRWSHLARLQAAALRLPRVRSVALLDEVLQRLSRRPRRDLLADLRGLPDWLVGLHGSQVITQLLETMEAVRRRWP